MKKNISVADRIVRMAIAVIIGALFIQGVLTGALGTILMVAAILLLLSAFLDFCPVYKILGITKWERKQV